MFSGKLPSIGEAVAAHEIRTLSLGAETEVLDLHQGDHGIIVIGLEKVDVLWCDARLIVERLAVERPAAAKLDRILGIGVVALDRGEKPRVRKIELFRRGAPHHEEAVGAGARHDAIEEADRVGDEARVEILLEAELLAKKSQRIGKRVLPLRDTELAVILTPRAVRHACNGR